MLETEYSIDYKIKLYIQEDASISRFGVLVFGLLIIVFTYSDFLIISTTSELFKVLLIKSLVLVASFSVYAYLKVSKEIKYYSLVIFTWLMLIISLVLYTGTTRPPEYTTHLALEVSIVLSIFVIFRNKLILQVIPSIYLSIGILLQLYFLKTIQIGIAYFAIIVATLVVIIIGIFVSYTISKFRENELSILDNEYKMKCKLKQMAFRDELTSLQNRRSILHSSKQEFERSKRYHKNLSLMILDIDDFKAINDRYGHENGDIALKFFAEIASSKKRSTDHIGRIGGEEFLLLLPETDANQARNIADRILEELNTKMIGLDEQKTKLTVSIGLTEVNDKDSTINECIRRADDFLYVAKERGKNNIYAGS